MKEFLDGLHILVIPYNMYLSIEHFKGDEVGEAWKDLVGYMGLVCALSTIWMDPSPNMAKRQESAYNENIQFYTQRISILGIIVGFHI